MRSIGRSKESATSSTHQNRSQCARLLGCNRVGKNRTKQLGTPRPVRRNHPCRATRSRIKGHQCKKVCNALACDHPKHRDARPPRQRSESLRAAAPRPGKNRACARPTEGRAQRFVQTGMTLGVCPKGGRKGRTQRFVRTGLDTQHADDSAVLNRPPIWPHDPRSTWWDTECASVLNLKTRRSTG